MQSQTTKLECNMKRSIFFALLTFIAACVDTEIVPIEGNDDSFLQDGVYSNVITLEDKGGQS